MRGIRHSSRRRRLRVVAAAATAGAVFLVAGATTIGSSAQPGVAPTVVPCGAVITVNTKLASDLSNCPDDGVVIGRNGVTLDLNGHTIDGNDMDADQGIDNTGGFDDLRVRGPGVIRDFSEGVSIQFADDSTVRRLRIVSNQDQGILVVDSDENVFEDNFLSGNGANGMFIMTGSDHGEVEDNVVSNNVMDGISLQGSDDTEIDDNSILDNGGSGVSLSMGSDGNRLTENFVFDNAVEGVLLDDSSNNRIERNAALDNGANGISVTNVSNNNRIRRNSASDNGADGILVDATSSGTLLVRNRAHRNAMDDGIEIANPVATVTRNTANNNAHYGIEAVLGVTDGGGNRASGNGNAAAQCLNVVCN